MEFLRFGSSIPGSYWGCCACCIIQDFNQNPDAKASIQLVSGDGGGPIVKDGKALFAGPTYRDIFWQRIRFGTFDKRDMPNHAFLAIITENQARGSIGKKWLAILKEAGFEFVRTVANSVYTGQQLLQGEPTSKSQNYIFGLFRNIGSGAIADPFTPPKEWTDLPSVGVPEMWGHLRFDTAEMAKEQREAQLKIWKTIPEVKLLTEDELRAGDIPVTLAGLRTKYKQQTAEQRENILKAEEEAKNKSKPTATVGVPKSPWGTETTYSQDSKYLIDQDDDDDCDVNDCDDPEEGDINPVCGIAGCTICT